MGRGRTSSADSLKEADDILAGRAKPQARHLLRLIHAVNPTSMDVSEKERARRYLIKSKLQSMLIRQFPEDLVVSADPVSARVSSIGHRFLDGDACHCVIDELDEDARAWVRLQLDTAERIPEQRTSRVRTAPTASSQTPIQRAHAALEAYDFDEARAILIEELTGESGAEAARLLLEILVETLALDEEALAIAQRLETRISSERGIRSLLAVAAGRSGAPDEAWRQLRDLDAIEAGPALAAIASRAIQDRAPAGADRALAEASRLGAKSPELLAAQQALGELRANAAVPALDSLQRAVEGGASDDDIEQAAREVLAVDPASATARAALRDLDSRLRRNRGQEALDRARRALAAGDTVAAQSALAAARVENVVDDTLADALETMRVADRASENEQRRDEVVSALSGPDAAGALTGFLALDATLRADVVARLSGNHAARCQRLEALGAASRSRARAAAAVHAVLALERAEAAIASEDGGAALALLSAHEETLAALPEARRSLSEAKELEARRLRADAERHLREARDAWERRDVETASAALDRLDRRALDAPGLAAAEAIATHLTEELELKRLRERFAERQAAGAWLEAREVLASLVARTVGTERARWEAELAEADRDVAQAFHVECNLVDEPLDGPLGTLLGSEIRAGDEGTPPVALSASGDRAFFVFGRDEWLFVAEADIAAQRVRRVARLRTGWSMEFTNVRVDGGVVRACGAEGVVELDEETLSIRTAFSLLHLKRNEKDVIEWVEPMPDGAIWVDRSPRPPSREKPSTLAIDRRGRILRDLGETFLPKCVPGSRQVLVPHFERGAKLVTPAGAADPESPAGLESLDHVAALCRHPEGTGFVAMAMDPKGRDEQALIELRPSRLPRSLVLKDTHEESIAAFGSLPGQLFTFQIDADDQGLLRSFASGRDGLVESWHARLPGDFAWFQNAAATALVALVPAETGLRAVRLREKRSSFPRARGRTRHQGPYPRISSPFSDCGLRAKQSDDEASSELAERNAFRADNKQHLSDVVQSAGEGSHSGRSIVAFADALALEGYSDLALDALQRAHVRRPSDPDILLELLHEYLGDGRWQEVVETARRAPPLADDAAAQHAGHLVGVAHYRLGNASGARDAWEQARRRTGGCEIAALLDLVAPPPNDPRAALADESASLPRRLHGALAIADERIAASDPAAALAVLESRWILARSDLQISARQTAAWLALAPQDPAARFRAANALTTFLDLQASSHRTDFAPLVCRWSAERLASLAKDAERWLAGERAPRDS